MNEPHKEPVEEAPVQEPERVANESSSDDEEYEYQPPVTAEEFRETVGDAAKYVKEAWLQPARRWIRGGFDAVEDFTRDLSGQSRRKRK